MANMSYCRFYNTYADLQDCQEALQNNFLDELSEVEKKYAIRLIKMCRDIADEFIEEIEEIEEFKNANKA